MEGGEERIVNSGFARLIVVIVLVIALISIALNGIYGVLVIPVAPTLGLTIIILALLDWYLTNTVLFITRHCTRVDTGDSTVIPFHGVETSE